MIERGELLIAWTEGMGWQRGGALAWQLIDADSKTIGEPHTPAGVPAWSFGAVGTKLSGFVIFY